MKKKIIIIIILIIAILAGIIGYSVYQDLKQEDNLKIELDDISNMINYEDMSNLDEINKRLDQTVTKKDYAVVEKAFKQYMKDFLKNTHEITEIFDDERIVKALSAENYKNDGPDFKETKELLKNYSDKLAECTSKYNEFLTEEKIMSYIDDKNLDDYYIELYRNELVGDIEKEKADKTVENSINKIIDVMNNSEDIIDFLVKNKGKWEIDGEDIVFDNQKLINEYQELIEKICY